MKLTQLKKHCLARIVSISLPSQKKMKLFYVGIYEGGSIEKICNAPLGDPSLYMVNGVQLVLRGMDACFIEVEEII